MQSHLNWSRNDTSVGFRLFNGSHTFRAVSEAVARRVESGTGWKLIADVCERHSSLLSSMTQDLLYNYLSLCLKLDHMLRILGRSSVKQHQASICRGCNQSRPFLHRKTVWRRRPRYVMRDNSTHRLVSIALVTISHFFANTKICSRHLVSSFMNFTNFKRNSAPFSKLATYEQINS